MSKYLTITIDTETDSPRWEPEFPYSLNNVKALPKLQNLFEKNSVKPTYLITYPVTQDKESVAILKDILGKKEAEVGTHLHPWTTPPFHSEKERLELSYPHRSSLEREKLANLTATIEQTFGVKALSYRAGRYGFDEDSLKILEELGYLVDSSITPTMNWSSDGGPNFARNENTQPYYLNRILEVPISIVTSRKLPGYNNFLPKVKAVLRRIGLVKTVWLRPSIASFGEMKWLADSLLDKGVSVLTIMFHSNELIRGTSPYVKTEREEEIFWERLNKILNYLVLDKKLESKTLSEIPLIL